jgi:hypothetical protein
VTGQQTGAAIGLAVLATIAATRTDNAHGSLTAGYRLSFLIATGMALAGLALVAAQLNARACQTELARQQKESGEPNPICTAEASLRRS